jgi:tRNA-splicing ligase RtcB
VKPIKIYAENADPAALCQFYEAMKLDCAVQGAVMPDVHKGYALPIGAVVASQGVVFPAWVGYDIGCGMCAVPTSFEFDEIKRNREEIFRSAYESIPMGLGKYNDKNLVSFRHDATPKAKQIFAERFGRRQLGTLGSGNHFIEIGVDDEALIWLIIHSGSRGIGHAIATHYMKLAADGRRLEWHHGFRTDSEAGADYIVDLNYGLAFALENRKEMMRRLIQVIKQHCTHGDASLDDPMFINRNHNHAEQKDGLWIHRKGATHAEKHMLGVVPGNMRDGSFIVRGKGNPESLCSSSHGAGRIASRTQIKKAVTMDDFREQMTGITAKVDKSTLDESPGAYKDIFEVMRLQSELVDIVCRVRPIINMKG